MNKNGSLFISIAALVLSIVAVIMSLKTPAAPEVAQSADVEETLNNNPEIIINAMQKYEQKLRDQALANAQKMITDNLDAINNDPNTPVIGNPDGSIMLVEFFDYSCGYCHRLYPALKNIIAKNPDVKVMVKSLAFVSPTSQYAAKAALAAGEQGKYAEMYSALFEMEGEMTEASIDAAAAGLGLDMEKYKADLNSAKVEAAMSGFSDLAGKIQVNGVPALVLNGEMLQTIDENVIQDKINEIKAAQ